MRVVAGTVCYDVNGKIVCKIQFHPPCTAYKVMAKGAHHVKTLYCIRSVGRKIGLMLEGVPRNGTRNVSTVGQGLGEYLTGCTIFTYRMCHLLINT